MWRMGRLLALGLLTAWHVPGYAQAVASTSARPRNIDQIDCAALRIHAEGLLPDLLTPGKVDLASSFKGFPPDLARQIARATEYDPDGLCRYRDENKALPAASAGRVVFMGDSITEMWRVAASDLFTGDVIDRGISGQNSGQMLARFRTDVIDLHPKVVHILAGINDLNGPMGSALTRSNIMSMVDLAQANGIAVVLASITPSSSNWMFPTIPTGGQIVDLDRWLRGYAARIGAVYVDYHTPLAAPDLGIRSALSNDGLHPNRDGFAIMTPLARSAIQAALRKAAR